MQNPVVAIRVAKGLTVSEFGVLTGVSPMTIQRNERGNLKKLTPAVLDVLEKWGYSKTQLAADYEEWKTFRCKQLLERV